MTGFNNERTHTVFDSGNSVGNGDSAYFCNGDGRCDSVDVYGDGSGCGDSSNRDGDGWGCGTDMVMAYHLNPLKYDLVPHNMDNVYAD